MPGSHPYIAFGSSAGGGKPVGALRALHSGGLQGDGVAWAGWTRLAAIERGHYQISIHSKEKCCTAFNYHPEPLGLNWRTNLYYLETVDFGETWRNAPGQPVDIPLTDPQSSMAPGASSPRRNPAHSLTTPGERWQCG